MSDSGDNNNNDNNNNDKWSEYISSRKKKIDLKKTDSNKLRDHEGISFKGIIVSSKELLKPVTKIFMGYNFNVLLTEFVEENISKKEEYIMKINETHEGTTTQVEEHNKNLTNEGKKPLGKNAKLLPTGKIYERKIKIGDIIEFNVWNTDKQAFSINPDKSNENQIYLIQYYNIKIQKKEDETLSEFHNATDIILKEQNYSEFLKATNLCDLKQNIVDIRSKIDDSNISEELKKQDPSFAKLYDLIGSRANTLMLLNTNNTYLEPTLDLFNSGKCVNSKEYVNIELLKKSLNNDNYRIPIQFQFNTIKSNQQNLIQCEIYKEKLDMFGINGLLFEQIAYRILKNTDVVIQGKISPKQTLNSVDAKITENEPGNYIVLFVDKIYPIMPSLFCNIGFEINYSCVEYLAIKYFDTSNFQTSNDKKKAKLGSVLLSAANNLLNKKDCGVYSLFELKEDLRNFDDDEKYCFFIIDGQNHSKCNLNLDKKFRNEKEKKYKHILEYFETGKSENVILFDVKNNNRDHDNLDFSIFAIERIYYNTYLKIKKENDEGTQKFQKMLDEKMKEINSNDDDNDDVNSIDDNNNIDDKKMKSKKLLTPLKPSKPKSKSKRKEKITEPSKKRANNTITNESLKKRQKRNNITSNNNNNKEETEDNDLFQ